MGEPYQGTVRTYALILKLLVTMTDEKSFRCGTGTVKPWDTVFLRGGTHLFPVPRRYGTIGRFRTCNVSVSYAH
jgi:hypothetical protein